MNPIALYFLYAFAALFCNFAHAVYVDPPKELTLLPQSSNLVFYAIYNNDILKDESTVFNAENSCLNELSHELRKALYNSGKTFRECYSLKDAEVEKYLNIANEQQLMEQFQQDNNKCPIRNKTLFYEFNCYVQVVQDYLQKVYSYVHKPQNSVEWNIQYQLALARYRALAICTGNELRSLMEAAKIIQDAESQCQ